MKFETTIDNRLYEELKKKTVIKLNSSEEVLDEIETTFQCGFFFRMEDFKYGNFRMRGRLEELDKLDEKSTLVKVNVTHPILNVFSLVWFAILILLVGYFISYIISIVLVFMLGIIAVIISDKIEVAAKKVLHRSFG